MRSIQTDLFDPIAPIRDATDYFSDADPASRGAIHTKPEVAEFILDLMGWDANANLSDSRLLEPSAGEGDFVIPAASRLLDQCQPNDMRISDPIHCFAGSIRRLRAVHAIAFGICL